MLQQVSVAADKTDTLLASPNFERSLVHRVSPVSRDKRDTTACASIGRVNATKLSIDGASGKKRDVRAVVDRPPFQIAVNRHRYARPRACVPERNDTSANSRDCLPASFGTSPAKPKVHANIRQPFPDKASICKDRCHLSLNSITRAHRSMAGMYTSDRVSALKTGLPLSANGSAAQM